MRHAKRFLKKGSPKRHPKRLKWNLKHHLHALVPFVATPSIEIFIMRNRYGKKRVEAGKRTKFE